MQAASKAQAVGPKTVAVIVVRFPAGNAGLISGGRLIQELNIGF